jgi:hypothetical protein
VFLPNIRDEISHPYRTTGKIIVLHIIFLSSLEKKMACLIVRTASLCGQCTWLQIQRPGFDSQRYQIF